LAVAAALIVAGAAQSGTSLRGQIVYEVYRLQPNDIQLSRERPDGSGRLRLTRGPDSYLRPNWSPDGQTIVAEGGPGFVIVSRDARTLRRIPVGGDAFAPRWSPTGTRIAYLVLNCNDPSSHEDPSCAGLWVMRPDGSGRRRLTIPTGVDASQGLSSLYSWSPDGRRIAYIGGGGVAVVDVTNGRTRFVWRNKHLIAQFPEWSPDGRWIMFAKQRAPGHDSDLTLVAPDGKGLHRLKRTLGADEPRWAPDGQHIAYLVEESNNNGASWSVIVARADGTAPIRVGAAGDEVLLWSPDSTHLLFAGSIDQFFIVRADGKGTRVRIPGGDDPDWGR
jgi:Tol biopolymer transport system component